MNSLYYGAPALANPLARHPAWSLERDLESDKLDPQTRAAIEAELARRATKKTRKKG